MECRRDRVVSTSLILALIVTQSFAAPAITTANVNFRAGPGTANPVIRTLPQGTSVDLLECDAAGSWYAVTADGQNGFLSGRYLQQTDDGGPRWPRAFGLNDGGFIVLYEPQFSAWTDFQELEALVAAEYHADPDADPVFGVIGLKADTARDIGAGTITLIGIELTQVDFATLDRNQIAGLSLGVGKLLPTEPIELREERVAAGLAAYQQLSDVDGLKADPPVIYHADGPARLLMTDGDPVMAPVKGDPGLQFVVNTNWDLFQLGDTYWMRDDTSWLSSGSLDGDWQVASNLPSELSNLPDDGNWVDARAAQPPAAYDGDTPQIFYSDQPAELIAFHGKPEWDNVPGGDLQWAANTDSDLFRLTTDGTYYYLVSGRWFSAASLDGPWSFATPHLPDDFLNIPDDVPYYTVRASVPGTSEANEARLRASIPEFARVNPDEITLPDVTYQGAPQFIPIEGTSLFYAVNSDDQVIQVDGEYYLIRDGIWFVSDSPDGPWIVASSVPDPIYDIPPSSPVYNVTYVRIYDTYDDGYLFGYTAGYRWGFLAWGLLVYGSGWWYPPYWGYPPGRPPWYRPYPVTFGGGIYYNPGRGVFGRYGYIYGPHRGFIGYRPFNRPPGYAPRGKALTALSSNRSFVPAFHADRLNTTRPQGATSAYARWNAQGVKHGQTLLADRAKATPAGTRWTGNLKEFQPRNHNRSTFAGPNGQVFRKTDGNWQKWNGNDGWKGAQPPVRPKPRVPDAHRERPAAHTKPAKVNQLPQTPNYLAQQQLARERANQRSNQQQSHRTRPKPESTYRAPARTPSMGGFARPSGGAGFSRPMSGGGAKHFRR